MSPPAPAVRPPVDTRQSASSLVDEAVHRLRLAPLATLGIYYAGSLPFVLALLYFCADMSRRADAEARGPGAALALAALFLGMKTAQAVFAARLRAQFARQPMPRWPAARLGRVLLVQTGLQAPGLFVLTLPTTVMLLPTPTSFNLLLSLVLTLPLGWEYAFYQNVTALGGGEAGVTAREVARRAWRHARARPRMNHAGLSILFGLGLFAWLGLLVAAVVLPQLVQMFTGEENVFTRDVESLFNTTLFLVSGALVYLAVDPLVKTFYALRGFYEDSARTGEDLLSDLRALPPVAAASTEPGQPAAGSRGRPDPAVLARAGLVVALGWTLAAATAAAGPLPAPAATPALVPAEVPAAGPSTVSPPALDRSIREVLGRREFAWRSARSSTPPAVGRQSAAARLVRSVGEAVGSHVRAGYQAVRDFLARVRRWLRGQEPAPAPETADEHGGRAVPSLLEPLAYLLCGVLAVGGGFLLWQVWRGKGPGRLAGRALGPVTGRALPPDLAAEDLLATQLPEDEWLSLARGLLASGERRLALRAFYLSLLAGLGERKLLVIARHKSNRDYLQELRRRTRDRPELPGAFGRSVSHFERVWYGSHPVDDGLLDAFQADREQALGRGE